MKAKDRPRVIIIILATLGIVLSVYLTYLHYSNANAAFCVAGSGCDTVRESSYSAIFGIPVALVGVIGYFLILLLSIISISPGIRWLSLYLVALAGAVFSAYLTYLELFVIKAICIYCVASAIIIAAIWVILLVKKPKLSPEISFAKMATLSGVVVGAVLIGSILVQSGGLSADDSSSNTLQGKLAKHLTETGAVMYGSYKCPHCLSQKRLFGDAFKYVTYVECHPGGENANPSLCFNKGIMSYPTWEMNGRFYVGTMSLQQLANLSGYTNDSAK
ncbi:MAG TPA: vitamin K epoxide reductase family protein [Thermodesulfobacteriota bacterium]|nr:vitamin K epoxide reductase family protein [Thermodesulfobacteriota bacterium]